MNLNSQSAIEGKLILPGDPQITVHNPSNVGAYSDEGGPASPTNHHITVNSDASVQEIVTRSIPSSLPATISPDSSSGTRWISLNSPNDSPGDFSTIRGLNINSNFGTLTIPAGAYQQISINSGNTVQLGVSESTTPSVYHIEGLNLNANARIDLLGPVEIRLKNSFSPNGLIGNEDNPGWLTLSVENGGMNLNSNAAFYGVANLPKGTLSVNHDATLKGGFAARNLNLNSGGILICTNNNGGTSAPEEPEELAPAPTPPSPVTTGCEFLVERGPNLNGQAVVQGSLRVIEASNVILNSDAAIQ